MKRYLTKFIIKYCYSELMEILTESFYGDIPQNLKEPSIMFFSDNRRTLERFFTIQAYRIQKKAAVEPKNAQFYSGMLAHIKSILVAVTYTKMPDTKENIPKGEEKGFLDKILEFKNSRKKKELSTDEDLT